MNEFDKNQNQGSETGAQGGKPAFGQFDKEQGEDRQPEKGEGRQEELTGAGQAGQQQQATGQGGQQQPQFNQKGEEIEQDQQEQGQAGGQDDQFRKDQGDQQR